MATLTRQQLEANIQAMEKQGASQGDIQSYLDTLKGPAVSRETASPSNFGAPAPQGDGFFKSLIKAPLKSLLVKPVVRTAQAVEGVGREVLGLGSDEGRRDWEKRATSDVNVPIPLLGDIKVEPVKSGFAGVKQALGEGLEAGSYLVGGGGAAAVGKGAVKSTLGRAAIQGAKVGAKSGAIYGAGQGLQEDKDLGGIVGSTITGATVGGIAGGATGAAFTGARHALLGKQSTEAEAQKAAGRIFQGSANQPGTQKFIEKDASKILSKIDTRAVRSYDDLAATLESHGDKLRNEVDAGLKASQTKLKMADLTREVSAKTETGRAITTKQNFVQDALKDLEELFTKTRNPAEKLRIRSIAQKAANEGLDPFEINQLAREYGTTFGKKAFGPQGPLTSVNAVTYENTRKGLKETARQFFEGDALQNLDEEWGQTIRLQKLANDMKSKVTALENRVKDRNFVEKLSRGVGGAIDTATFGGPRAFITKLLFPSNVGLKTMNSIDLQNELASNLRVIRNLEGASDSALIAGLRGLAIKAGLIKPVSNFGKVAAPKLGSEAVDKTVAKIPTARYTKPMTKTAVKNPKFTQDTINKMRPGEGKAFFQKALDKKMPAKPRITEREVQDWVGANLSKYKSQESLVSATAKKFNMSTLEARDNVLDHIEAAIPPEDRAGLFAKKTPAVPKIDVKKTTGGYAPKGHVPQEGQDFSTNWDSKKKTWYATQLGSGTRIAEAKDRDALTKAVQASGVTSGVYSPKSRPAVPKHDLGIFAKSHSAQSLMDFDSEIWDKLGIRSGGQLDKPEMAAKYYAELAKAFAQDGKWGGQKVPQSVVDELEDQNFHSLVEFLHTRKLIKK